MKLLALDLDGTLLEPDKRVSPEAIEALRLAVQRGVIVGTASGRSLRDQLNILSSNGLGPSAGFPHFLIVDECLIYVLKDGLYVDLAEHNSQVRQMWLQVFEVAKRVLEEELARLLASGVHIMMSVTSEEESRIRYLIAVFFEHQNEAEVEEKRLNRLFMELGLPLHCTRNYRIVTVLHSYCDKGVALLKVSEFFRVPHSKVLAVGDSANDIPMFDQRYGFTPATTENAEGHVENLVIIRGGYVASRPRSRGVAEIVQKLVLA
ncbi:MAG: HAD family hydrolase [Thermofilaceae archaeon]